MKDLKFLCAQPDDEYYRWQTHLWLESLKEINHSDKALVVVFTPSDRFRNKDWDKLIELYPEAEFAFYKDENSITKLLGIYIPLLRPYILMRYFKDNPEMKEKAVFYCDCDVLFTKTFNIDKYINDNTCYVSDTNSYINADYFDSKVKDVLFEKIQKYQERDILDETAKLVGINREIAEKNNKHSGGAQYFLKNIDYTFWDKVLTDCIKIRLHLQNVNKEFFASENKGFQSWCADMWAVLWNLWLREQEVKIVPEMDFSWSSDPSSKLEKTGIFHNAGIGAEKQKQRKSDIETEFPTFHKGKYHGGLSPFSDPHVEYVYNNEDSKNLCNWYYVSKLIELKKKYNLK